MKKVLFILLVVSVFVSGCSNSFDGVIVGKSPISYSVDVMMENEEIRTVYLTKEEFYSGDFELGFNINFSCRVYNCFPE